MRVDRRSLRGPLHSITMIVTGGAAAVSPVSLQAAGARSLGIHTQGVLALSLTIGTFLGQVIGAWVVESRLATPTSSVGSVPFPVSLLAAGAAGGAAVIVAPSAPVAIGVGVPLLTATLVAGRMVTVTSAQLRREIAASIAVLGGIGLAAAASFRGSFSFRAVIIGAVMATVLRYQSKGPVRPVSPRIRWWVTSETTVIGIAQPVVNLLLLTLSGPVGGITFRAVSTVSAAVEPAISYTRLRLLVAGSRRQLALGIAAVSCIVVGLIGLQLTGLLGRFLGGAWRGATLGVLVTACVWRASALLWTSSFARMRRRGLGSRVFWLRTATSVWYLVLTLPIAVTGNVLLIFAALAVAEATTAIGYRLAERRSNSRGARDCP